MNDQDIPTSHDTDSQGWRAYRPLIVLLAATALAALARQLAGDSVQWAGFMHDFMGLFLMVFALLKLFDPGQFADGFSMYDLLASRWRPWGWIYPWIELLLGLGYLSRFAPHAVYTSTILVMGFGALGVIHALRQGLKVNCACMGNVLQVPLSTVAVVEDGGMLVMASLMLLL